MIARVPGWSWSPGGGGVTIAPPGGGAAIRYRERLRPVRSVASLLRDRAADQRFRPTQIGPVERLITAEGEYAAVIELAGVLQAPTLSGAPAPITRTLAFLFTDDWYSEIAGIAVQPALAATVSQCVRRLATASRLQLGARRRRFVYTPPPGWAGHQRLPLFTTWFAPEHPRRMGEITVYPAVPTPVGIDEPVGFDLLPFGSPADAQLVDVTVPRTPLQLGPLEGATWELRLRDEQQRTVHRTMAMVRDARYLYTAYLDRSFATAAPTDESLAAFTALLASIEPLPAPHASARIAGLTSDFF